jgi:pyruvate/2-oxoglutarate dehydrogenase complex dihydrolipoamide dehydrogenase (E3) component
MRERSVDLCVIGAGSAGLTATALAARLGVRVALVERGELGGECLHDGCVPSKALLAAAKAAQALRSGERLGIAATEPRVDFAAVQAHVQRAIAAIAPHDSAERFAALGAQVIRAEARFVEPRVLMAGDDRIRARRVVIATGAGPALPKIDGLDGVPYLTNRTIFANRELPAHLLVLGGGPLGIELAQAHRRLGARVTVLSHSKALPRDDAELAGRLLRALAAEGVVIRQNVKVRAARRSAAGIALAVDEGGQTSDVEGSHLLVAVGRQPELAALDLEHGGVRFDEHGIAVDAKLRTSARGVFAIGDVVAGAPRFTHVAAYQAGIAVQNALLWPFAKTDYRTLPWVTYCEPELAQVGASEDQARKRYGDAVRVLTVELGDNDRAQAEAATGGALKLVAHRGGRALGVSILAPHAGELAHLWVAAIGARCKLSALARMIAPYPTFGEAGKAAAAAFVEPRLFGAWPRRAVRWFSRLP